MNVFSYLSSACATAALGLRRAAAPAQPATPRRVLVLGYAAIGDLIFFLPVLETLRRTWPEAKIVFLANPYPTTEELIPATGLVDEVWLADWEGPAGERDRRGINRRIHEAGFDLAVLSLSAPAHYFQWGLRDVPVRVGHRRPAQALGAGSAGWWGRVKRGLVAGEFARAALLNRPAWLAPETEHALSRNLRLLTALGLSAPAEPPRPRLPISPAHRKAAERLLGPAAGRPRIALHLGAPGNLYGKMWAPERFAGLARRIAEKYPAQLVVVGGPEEAQAAGALASALNAVSVAGNCSLLETFAVIETCALFLGNDTGLAKAAMALGVPTATWWGPSDPAEYGAVWEPEKHLDIRTGIACSPCTTMGMPRLGVLNYTDCGHHDCLRRLEEGFAWEALSRKHPELLGAGSRSS